MKLSRPRADLILAFVSQGAYKALGFVVLAVLARALAPEDYGRLMFSLSMCLLAASLTDLGMSQDLIRRVAPQPAGAIQRLNAVLGVRGTLLIAYVVAINAWALATKPDIWAIVAGMSLYAVGFEINRTFAALFVGLQRIADSIRIYGLGLLVLATGVSLAAWAGKGLPWMVVAYVTAAAVLVLRGTSLARRTVGRVRLKLRTRALLPFVAGTVPLFGLTIMVALYLSVDSVMLGYLQPYGEVARYEAASKILEASQFMVRPLTLVLFPICSKLAAQGRWQKLGWTFRWATAGGTLLGILIWGAMQAVADPVIRVVYTESYASSAEVLRILFWASPAIYVATVASFLAASIRHDRLALAAVVTGTALNIGLNLLLIPDMGAIGAAWATVAAQSTNALLLVLVVTWGIRTSRKEGSRTFG